MTVYVVSWISDVVQLLWIVNRSYNQGKRYYHFLWQFFGMNYIKFNITFDSPLAKTACACRKAWEMNHCGLTQGKPQYWCHFLAWCYHLTKLHDTSFWWNTMKVTIILFSIISMFSFFYWSQRNSNMSYPDSLWIIKDKHSNTFPL